MSDTFPVTFPAVFRTMITVHADVVGSLLRPPKLIEARIRLAAGGIDASRFRGIGLEKCTGSLFPPWSGRAGRFLQNHQRVGYTTESYVGVARGGATGVNDLTGCGRKPFGTAG